MILSVPRSTVAVIAAGAIALAALGGAGGAAASARGGGHPAPRGPRAVASTAASALRPPTGQLFTGVSAGPAGTFAAEVGKHPAVYGAFVTWGRSLHWAFSSAIDAHARLMLHISTTMGYGARQAITPAGIAQGQGDAWLLGLSAVIAQTGRPVYVRLLPEMNQANNAYCAFNPDGSSRGPSYTPRAFIAAWRRTAIVLRGGPVSAIDAQLEALGQPRLQGSAPGAALAGPPIAFVWTPQTAGSPDIPANSAATYYPGDDYVDWVGTDFYSKFPNFAGLDAFYRQYPQKPFAFGEWAIWGGDSPGFVDQLFSWVDAHRRVQMMLYNQGYVTNGPFRLNEDPASSAAIRQRLAPSRFLAFTPEW